MPRAKDLTGQRFGRLIAIKPTSARDKAGGVIWECQCDCENPTKTSAHSLLCGNTQSCGCLSKEVLHQWQTNQIEDLSGKRFGRLTVKNLVGFRKTKCGEKSSSPFWECVCDCGCHKVASANSLKQGNIKSCGCLSKESSFKRISPCEENVVKNYDGTSISIIESKKVYKNNLSGVRGVCWDKRTGKWLATLKFKGNVHNLGEYLDIECAKKARKAAEDKYFKPEIEKYYQENPN